MSYYRYFSLCAACERSTRLDGRRAVSVAFILERRTSVGVYFLGPPFFAFS